MEKHVYEHLINLKAVNNYALCTVLSAAGSTPRKDYPVMVVDKDNNTVGTVGGGAMEHNVINTALDVIQSVKPALTEFDMGGKIVHASESICGGRLKVLVEPITKELQAFYQKHDLFSPASQDSVLVIRYLKSENRVFRVIVNPDSPAGSDDDSQVKQLLTSIRGTGRSCELESDDSFYLGYYLQDDPTLHIFGAGHVGAAVADLANQTGLKVALHDDRSQLANAQRFPYADSISNLPPEDLSQYGDIRTTDFVLVSTRNHVSDFSIMKELLSRECAYLGLMSSPRKWSLLRRELESCGISSSRLDAVYSPVGLDIGSETVPEIAVSILSEIILTRRKKQRTPLSLSVVKLKGKSHV